MVRKEKKAGRFRNRKRRVHTGEEGIEPWAWLLEDSPECEILHAPHHYYAAVLRSDQTRWKIFSETGARGRERICEAREPMTICTRIYGVAGSALPVLPGAIRLSTPVSEVE
jgi:hypothetical protein